MWQVETSTPFRVAGLWVLDRDGAKHWSVAAKACFDILPDGRTRIAGAQAEEPGHLPRYAGEDGWSSLLEDTDLVMTEKPATDVVVHATAHAPGGRPATSVVVGLAVGRLRKRLRVTGDRLWLHGGGGVRASEPEPFLRMPIRYERAFGGMDATDPDPARQGEEPRNPIGTGFALRAERLAGARLPNVELPGEEIRAWDDRPPPVGFGPVPSHWLPRRAHAGTYDAAWQRDRFPLWPLDFSPRWFQCAPEDQQVTPHLRGGEVVELAGLTSSGLLRVALPRHQLVFRTRIRGRVVEHRPKLATVRIEPDAMRLVLTWHGALRCHRDADALERTLVVEKAMV